MTAHSVCVEGGDGRSSVVITRLYLSASMRYDAEMQTDQIVLMLIAERDRLSSAIEVLQGPTKRRGRPPKNAAPAPDFDHNAPNVPDWVKPASAKAPAPKRTMSAAGRKAIADAARKRWRLIKAGKAASPFAKKAKKAATA